MTIFAFAKELQRTYTFLIDQFVLPTMHALNLKYKQLSKIQI